MHTLFSLVRSHVNLREASARERGEAADEAARYCEHLDYFELLTEGRDDDGTRYCKMQIAPTRAWYHDLRPPVPRQLAQSLMLHPLYLLCAMPADLPSEVTTKYLSAFLRGETDASRTLANCVP
jgi:hypothetical protein